MSTATCNRFEFRCTGCYQSLVADTDQMGSIIDCQWCECRVLVPEPTDDAIERARKLDEDPEAGQSNTISFDEEELDRDAKSARALQLAWAKKKTGACRNPATAAASRLARLLAQIADTVITTLFTFGCLALAHYLQPTTPEQFFNRPDTVHWQYWTIGVCGPAGLVLFYWYTISFYGKTIGKYLLRVKIVDASGFPPGFLQGVLIRNSISVIATFVPLVPLFVYLDLWPESLAFESKTSFDLACLYVFAFSFADIALIGLEPPRCLHDRLAGTYVIDG